jgi:hypothetical protein
LTDVALGSFDVSDTDLVADTGLSLEDVQGSGRPYGMGDHTHRPSAAGAHSFHHGTEHSTAFV